MFVFAVEVEGDGVEMFGSVSSGVSGILAFLVLSGEGLGEESGVCGLLR